MRNIHGFKIKRKTVSFLSFKGDDTASSLDQITLPPEVGITTIVGGNMFHAFGEWLKREGHAWEALSEEELCRLSCDYFNSALGPYDRPRRFDRMTDPVPLTD